jgi:hypothetical protein
LLLLLFLLLLLIWYQNNWISKVSHRLAAIRLTLLRPIKATSGLLHSVRISKMVSASFQTTHRVLSIWTLDTMLGSRVPYQWGSVTYQMAVPVPSISCCVLNHHNLFYHIQNALAFNRDMCCHLALCFRLLPFHCATTAAPVFQLV